MKLLKSVPVALLLTGGSLLSHFAWADDSVFSVMDDPATAKKDFGGNINAGYLAQSGNTKSSSLTANTNMTWYQEVTAWSLWGSASNTSSNDIRSSEKYSVGGRGRYNLSDSNYLFGQASWLSDRYNGYHARDIFTAGYGRQILAGPVHFLRLEAGPGIRYDEYVEGGHKTQGLGYASAIYNWQFNDNAKFTQGVSFFGADDSTVNTETSLDVAINDNFGLKIGYYVTWNSEPPASAPNRTDKRTQITLGYKL